jgi:hypothetical protein
MTMRSDGKTPARPDGEMSCGTVEVMKLGAAHVRVNKCRSSMKMRSKTSRMSAAETRTTADMCGEMRPPAAAEMPTTSKVATATPAMSPAASTPGDARRGRNAH